MRLTVSLRLNPNKFEPLIHVFSMPLDTAREVVRRIVDGSIVQYRKDSTTGGLVRKG